MSPTEPAATHWFHERNPLLDGIPSFDDPDVFMQHLSYSPLAGLDIQALSFMARYEILSGEKAPLVPTTQSLRAAMTWYGMLRIGLRVRNPMLVEARRRYWDMLNADADDVGSLPKSPTSGIAVQVTKGPTGTAKTVTAKRFCAMLGRQRIDHVESIGGWDLLAQLVYLYTDLSHDGSRGGFLLAILMRMDEVLGTHYAIDLPKRYKSLDKLAVATVRRLIAHYTGIVFIDEGQLRNLMLSDQAELMQIFLLALMNSGIPLVLIGNERAFDWIDYSQDLTRLNSVPPEYFHPVGAIDHPDVQADRGSLWQGISQYYVLDEPPTDPDECESVLHQCGGGIARLELTLWTSVQRNVLCKGGGRVSASDILEAYRDTTFDDLRPIADGFAKRLPELLLRFPDVSAHYYAKHWGKSLAHVGRSLTAAEENRESRSSTPEKKRRTKRNPSGPTKLKAEQTRKKKAEAARAHLHQTLTPDDMRREGLKAMHLEGLDAIRERIESSETS